MPSTTHQRALEVLKNGLWHDYEETLHQVGQAVPPNKAVHEADRARVVTYRQNHPGVAPKDVPPRRRNASLDRQVAVGRRMLARTILANPAFEVIVNPETKKQLVRLFNPANGTTLPEGFVLKGKPRSLFYGLTPEEVAARQRQRGLNAARASWKNRGIDPENHVTQVERDRQRKERWAKMTPEERRAVQKEASRRGWETRRRNQQEGK